MIRLDPLECPGVDLDAIGPSAGHAPCSAGAAGSSAPSLRQIAEVLIATTLVVGFPIAMVWWARSSGRVSWAGVGLALGMLFSLAASSLGCLVWEVVPGSEDLLFSE